jgi:hypothetical protein
MVEKIASCEEVWPEISNYVEGEVDPPLRSALEHHLHACARCSSLLAGVRNVVHLYGDERMLLDVPVGFSRRLEKRLAQSSVARESRWSSWSAWLLPVAAMLLIAVGVELANTFTYRNPPRSLLAEPGHGIPPEMLVVVSTGSRLFHVAGCEFIHDKATERTITARQAMQDGYVPCVRCLRQYLGSSLRDRSDFDASTADLLENREESTEGEESSARAGHSGIR